MVNESVVNAVKLYLQTLVEQGIPVYQGVIFGSHVSGQADIWSDIDLLVISPLISIGREVQTKVGSIDNLYLSPQGYLTIVETKLWRNPQARREVVGQIIDYAKEVSKWSFNELEERVRSYNQQYRGSNLGIIQTLQLE